MLLNYKNHQYDVIAKLKSNDRVQYVVYNEMGNLFIFDRNDEMIEESDFLFGYHTDDNTVSEYEGVTKNMYQRIYVDDYFTVEEKKYADKIKKEIEKNFLPLKKEIKKEYYRYKIQKGEFKLWKNNFLDLIYQVGNNEYYIDDREFDIFYKIEDDGEYKFEFLEK